MISVTAAANSLRRVSHSLNHRRSFGAHFKAYGNGRISVSSSLIKAETEVEEENHSLMDHKRFKYTIHNSLTITTMCCIIKLFFTGVKLLAEFIKHLFKHHTYFPYQRCAIMPSNVNSDFCQLNDKCILFIFSYLNANDLISVKFSCRKFHKLIDTHAHKLSKFQVDQVKLHFDEGEFIVYPLDERIVPIRRPMLTIESLLAYLRHVSTLSLFIRGLIPIETAPVLKRLAKLRLHPSQLYFLWCDFDEDAEHFLKDMLQVNSRTVTDIGFEICGPSNVISDHLIRENLPRLNSLRIWNESSNEYHQKKAFTIMDCENNGIYAITNRTIDSLARYYSDGVSCLELLDLASTECSVSGLMPLIEAWYKRPPITNLNISLRNSTCHDNVKQVRKLARHCATLEIPLANQCIFHPNGYQLSLYIT